MLFMIVQFQRWCIFAASSKAVYYLVTCQHQTKTEMFSSDAGNCIKQMPGLLVQYNARFTSTVYIAVQRALIMYKYTGREPMEE